MQKESLFLLAIIGMALAALPSPAALALSDPYVIEEYNEEEYRLEYTVVNPNDSTEGDIIVDDEKVIPLAEGLTFQGLGFLPGGGPDSYAYGVSADGRVVVGSSRSGTMYKEAFRWTAEEGMTGLGDLPGGGDNSYAQAVSADGSVVVGGSSGEFPNGGNDLQPFRWTLSGGMVSLGGLSDYWGGLARSVSGDGLVIVGHGYVYEGWQLQPKAFRWTETEGMVALGTLIGGIGRSEAYGVSADGKVIVGNSNSEIPDYYERQAFIWTALDGMTNLGDLPNGNGKNYARAVSADGSVVVGYAWSSNSREAYYWTAEEGMVSLGQLPNGTFARFARDVSADGSVIVGEAPYAKAFIWDKENGARLLQEVLENEHGLELTGWKLEQATGVSDNGHTIVGYGINPNGVTEAWIVTPRVDLGSLVGLELRGPNEVQERSLTSYKAVACYDSGARRDVSNVATFSLESDTYATIDNDGLLRAKEIETPQDIVIHSTYNIDGVIYEAEKTVTVIYYVPIYVPDDYETIKDAIFNAKDGDIIVVRDGLYNGEGNRNLEFGGRDITVRSEDGPENCIIDCEGKDRAFTFNHHEGPDSILEGLAITRASGSAIYCYSSTGTSRSKPTIRNCIFIDNSATSGGAIYNRSGTGSAVTSPTIMNCTFIGNTASSGGAIYNRSGTGSAVTSPTIMNCTFIGNTASSGGAIYNSSSTGSAVTSPTIMNCTFIGNTASSGGAIYSRQGASSSRTEVTITSCIFWDNSNEQITGDSGTTTVSYSCIQGGHQGIGNIDTDPLFVDPSGGDYHLLPASPCIDTGDPDYLPAPDETDLDGLPRVIGGRIDMGAYEFNHIPVADAGPDQTVYAWFDGIAKVILDGSSSYDDDGDVLSCLWNWIVDGNSFTALGLRPIVELPVGEHIIELTVNDGIDDSEPDEVFIVVLPAMATTVKLTPRVLNLNSQGHWLKAHFVLPVGFSVEDVNANTPATVEPFGIESEYMSVSVNEDGRVEIKAAFDRATFCDTGMDYGPAEVAVVGLLTSGQYFYGIDTIKIITNQLKFLGVLASYWLQTSCDKPDWCGGFDLDQDGVVNFRDFVLFDGCCIEVIKQ
jgi:probable HAF family extracellular repeat protein/predicted outer membrane repeat protein